MIDGPITLVDYYIPFSTTPTNMLFFLQLSRGMNLSWSWHTSPLWDISLITGSHTSILGTIWRSSRIWVLLLKPMESLMTAFSVNSPSTLLLKMLLIGLNRYHQDLLLLGQSSCEIFLKTLNLKTLETWSPYSLKDPLNHSINFWSDSNTKEIFHTIDSTKYNYLVHSSEFLRSSIRWILT